MSNHSSFLLLITLWASVQDGKYFFFTILKNQNNDFIFLCEIFFQEALSFICGRSVNFAVAFNSVTLFTQKCWQQFVTESSSSAPLLFACYTPLSFKTLSLYFHFLLSCQTWGSHALPSSLFWLDVSICQTEIWSCDVCYLFEKFKCRRK